jgi:hypothetical protein
MNSSCIGTRSQSADVPLASEFPAEIGGKQYLGHTRPRAPMGRLAVAPSSSVPAVGSTELMSRLDIACPQQVSAIANNVPKD